jgi:bifunctional DNA-binding transcriptional regulator/antitoxin component of YhaV-PrlF toxin-antitoxin module
MKRYIKATEIVRRIDDLGRVVIPKEIRRTLRIREGDHSYTTLTQFYRFCVTIHSIVDRYNLM